MRSGKMFGAAALAAALAAAGCGSSSSGGGDLDQFGYIGTVFTVDNCAAFNLAAGNDFLFSLVSGAVQLTKPGGANCQAVFFGVGTFQDQEGGFERTVSFDLAADLGVADCAGAPALTAGDIRGRAWTLVKTQDGTNQEMQCAGAGAGGDILDSGNPVSLSATCTIENTTCEFTLQGGLFSTFDVLSAIRGAPEV